MSDAMLAFLICRRCARAWSSPVIARCKHCGDRPRQISPFTDARLTWLETRLDTRRRIALMRACNAGAAAHQRSLARAIAARGNQLTRYTARPR